MFQSFVFKCLYKTLLDRGQDTGQRIQRTAQDTGNHWLQMAERRTLGSEWRKSLAITFSPSDVTTLSTFSLSLVTEEIEILTRVSVNSTFGKVYFIAIISQKNSLI